MKLTADQETPMRFFRHLERSICVLFVCFPVLLFASSSFVTNNDLFSIGSEPAWIKKIDFLIESIPQEESEEDSIRLLFDSQIHLEEKVCYYHGAIKILDHVGVARRSFIDIEFDPSYQTVHMHTVRVYRNGHFFDLLRTSRLEILHRESNLEKYVYNGHFIALFFLDDIRVGDIIEYAYSLVGELPIHPTLSTHTFPFQCDYSISKLHYRILCHPSKNLFIQPFHTSIEPEITDLSPDLREWQWETLSTPVCLTEHAQPSWYDPCERTQISLYKDWQEVVQELVPEFVLSEDLKNAPSKEILNLVEQWKSVYPNPIDQATCALRFVQDEVRYFAFQDYLGRIVPRDARLVLQQRYGDCKNKSMLLHALLFFMGIQSKPVLVHTSVGRFLPDRLASTHAFDHVILRIDIENKSYWVDPTAMFQGGSLQNTSLPNYYWGLVLSPETTGLEKIPEWVQQRPTEIDTSIALTSSDFASISTKFTYYDDKANHQRWFSNMYGKKWVSNDLLRLLQKKYPGATLSVPLAVSDDREKNIVTYTVTCEIPIRNQKSLRIKSFTIDDYLQTDIDSSRSSPFSLIYPCWVREHIHVACPDVIWPSSFDQVKHTFDTHAFSYSSHIEANSADFDYELRYHQDHISVSQIQDYNDNVTEVSNRSCELPLM